VVKMEFQFELVWKLKFVVEWVQKLLLSQVIKTL